MSLLRLKGRKACDRLQKLGNSWKGKHMVVRWMLGPPRGVKAAGVYFGMRASTKLDKSAVRRNRMRRRCKEAFRLAIAELPPINVSAQLFLSPRASSLTVDFSELQSDARRFLSFLTSSCPPQRPDASQTSS
ncbi:ribonuclease P protein component [Candidatus Peribacteria bacterium]|nr:ribonuclease P protein component [Candidatus Peribacteria bacterium]